MHEAGDVHHAALFTKSEADRDCEELAAEHAELRALCQRVSKQGVQAATAILRGDPSAQIVKERRRISARMIIMGSHGHGGLYHLLLGGVSEGVIREAQCPVVLVPSRCLADEKEPNA